MGEFYRKMKQLLKNILISANDFITGKTNRVVRNYLVVAVVAWFLTKMNFITNYIYGFSPKLGSLYLGMLFFIFFIFFTAIAAVSMNFMFEKINERYNTTDEKYNKSLSIWLGEDYVSERFIYNLFSDNADENYNAIKNLNSIKDKLVDELGEDIINYRLFKNHLEYKQRKNSTKKLKIIMFTLFGTLFTASISPFIQKASNIGQYIDNMDFVFLFKYFAGMEYYSFIFLYLGVGISVYFMILNTYSRLTELSRRNEYLISILVILIEEKKTNQ